MLQLKDKIFKSDKTQNLIHAAFKRHTLIIMTHKILKKKIWKLSYANANLKKTVMATLISDEAELRQMHS